MNTDIRLSVGFWQHPKVFRLEKQLGLKAVRSLQILWCWCAQNRPDGNLSDLNAEEIEFVADWRGRKGAFVEACIGSWIDQTDDGFWLHEWAEYNPYQAQAGSREEARKEKARKAANARWQKRSSNNANGYSSDATGNAQAYANDGSSICSSDATGNAQAMPTHTSTSTSTKSIKGSSRIPPLPPQGGTEGAEAREPEILPTPDSPGKGPADEPGIEFHELREAWNAAMRPEGPLAGFPEYKALKKARDGTGMSCWPGIGMILDSAEKRKSLGAWNPGYEPGLAKFLKERTWEAPLPRPRASPQSTTRPAGKSLTRKNLETAALVLAEMDREDAENARRQGA